jgi:ABC-type multidrug transport system fused ATPase/permease subunit
MLKSTSRIDPDQLFAPKEFSLFLWKHVRYLKGYLFWRLISVFVIIPFPVISQRIVDQSIPDKDIQALVIYTVVSLVLLAIHFFSMRVAVVCISENLQAIIREMRARIFQKLQFMHFGFLDSTQLGRMLSKYAFDTTNIESAAIPILTMVIPELVRGVLLIATLAWMDPKLLVFVALSLPIFAWIRSIFFSRIEEWNHRVRMDREKLTGQANEYISAIKLVRGFGQETVVSGAMDQISDRYAESRRSQMRVNQTMGYVIFTLYSAINILAIAFGGWYAIQGSLSIGTLIALVGALPAILNPINLFSQVSIQYFLGRESYLSIRELVTSVYVENWRGTILLRPLKGVINFKQVSFRYEKGKPNAIDNIDLTITAGEHVAFVGPSGSGKSSMVNLILGLYSPNSGTISIDGIEQKDLAIRAFRGQCAIVMQDSFLLSGTLLENLRFSKPDATIEEVIDATRQANAWRFIKELPDGLETKVGERGVSLSGGQRQRIAIARALLRNPRLLILDEATSALDYESEAVVQEAIDRLANGRTTITIAHRLSTVRNVDRIVVLEGGKIVETGTYDELAQKSGSYFEKLLNAQGK